MANALSYDNPNQSFVDQAIPWLHGATMKEALAFYRNTAQDPDCDDWVIGELAKYDRFFLLTHILNRPDAIHPWQYERAREIEADPDGYLDLWARDHYKSTWITFAGSIQEIIKNPDITIGLFSHTKNIASAFLNQIMTELETNIRLPALYPHIFYPEPQRQSKSWSSQNGILVMRETNPKEYTIEPWGLVDGQPTSKHYMLMIFDDIVTLKSVGTAEQIEKTSDAWFIGQNLMRSDSRRQWHAGTRYDFADTYGQLLDMEALKPRIYPATEDGTIDGVPVFLTPEVWEDKKSKSSEYIIACQQLLNPSAGSQQEFKPEWRRMYEIRPMTLNVYILGDYAGSKAKGSSNTAFAVIGMDSAFNKYLLDGAVHKMSLDERWIMLKNMRNHWVRQPGIQSVSVGYEKYGAQSDIEHFQTMMRLEKCTFEITEVNWVRENSQAKDNRIRRLIPDHKNWKFFYPYHDKNNNGLTSMQRDAEARGQGYLIAKRILRTNENKKVYDVVEWTRRNEYQYFPNTTKKDMLDAMSRFYDMEPVPPMIFNEQDVMPTPEE